WATIGGSLWSSPSQTNPSVNWCRAKSRGMAANSNSRLCFTSVSVATPMAPSMALPTKLALAEKHTKPSAWVHTHHNVRLDGGFGEISFVAAAVTVGGLTDLRSNDRCMQSVTRGRDYF